MRVEQSTVEARTIGLDQLPQRLGDAAREVQFLLDNPDTSDGILYDVMAFNPDTDRAHLIALVADYRGPWQEARHPEFGERTQGGAKRDYIDECLKDAFFTVSDDQDLETFKVDMLLVTVGLADMQNLNDTDSMRGSLYMVEGFLQRVGYRQPNNPVSRLVKHLLGHDFKPEDVDPTDIFHDESYTDLTKHIKAVFGDLKEQDRQMKTEQRHAGFQRNMIDDIETLAATRALMPGYADLPVLPSGSEEAPVETDVTPNELLVQLASSMGSVSKLSSGIDRILSAAVQTRYPTRPEFGVPELHPPDPRILGAEILGFRGRNRDEILGSEKYRQATLCVPAAIEALTLLHLAVRRDNGLAEEVLASLFQSTNQEVRDGFESSLDRLEEHIIATDGITTDEDTLIAVDGSEGFFEPFRYMTGLSARIRELQKEIAEHIWGSDGRLGTLANNNLDGTNSRPLKEAIFTFTFELIAAKTPALRANAVK